MAKLDVKKLVTEWAWAVFIISVIFYTFAYSLYLGLSNLVNFLPFIIVNVALVILVGVFIKTCYSKKIFSRIYEALANPTTILLILTIFFLLTYWLGSGYYLFITVIFFFVFLTSFTTVISLYFLRKEKHKFQTVWAQYISMKFPKWYFILSVMFAISFAITSYVYIWNVSILPLVEYVATMLLQFILLTFATSGVIFQTNQDMQKYCKAGLEVVREGLDHPRTSRGRVEEHLSIFSSVIARFNRLADNIYPLSPHIPESYLPSKALYASILSGKKQLLETTKKGIARMINSLQAGRSKKGVNFYNFVSGLTMITKGQSADVKKEFTRVQEAFETESNRTKFLSKTTNRWLVGTLIAILLTSSSIYVSFRIGDPESGYNFVKGVLGENFAKLLFPIGEASIVNPMHNAEVTPISWYGNDRLNGGGIAEYSFQVLNNHFRKIMITNINVAGPSPITQVYMSHSTSLETSVENINFEIENTVIKSPSEPIIFEAGTSGTVVVTLKVNYDLRALRSALEEENAEQMNITGWAQILVSYEIMGKDIKESITENVEINFILSTTFLLGS